MMSYMYYLEEVYLWNKIFYDLIEAQKWPFWRITSDVLTLPSNEF